jgi:hypothetical protein
MGVDRRLDEMDRRLLRVIIDHYDGGPVGVETLAAALAEPRDTLEDVYEPFLLQQGFLAAPPRPHRDPARLRAPEAAARDPSRPGQAVLIFSPRARWRGALQFSPAGARENRRGWIFPRARWRGALRFSPAGARR